MSRSGYIDLCDSDEERWALIRWRGAVKSAIRGKRGQAFLREMAAAMDAMPNKRIIRHELEKDGEFCALGVVGTARRLDMESIDPYEPDDVSELFGIAPALAREIVYENDEGPPNESSSSRWRRMRRWIQAHLPPND